MGGGSTIYIAPVETWICQFIPRYVRMWAESFVLVPLVVLGNVFLGSNTALLIMQLARPIVCSDRVSRKSIHP